MTQNTIPPRGYNSRSQSGLMAKLRVMQVGESVTGPRHWEKTAYDKAKKAGVRIVLRRLGFEDSVTVFREA